MKLALVGILFSISLAGCSNILGDENIITRQKVFGAAAHKLYVYMYNWGVTSDKQLTIITSAARKQGDLHYDSTAEYVFEGLTPFSYYFVHDSLFVYPLNGKTIPHPYR